MEQDRGGALEDGSIQSAKKQQIVGRQMEWIELQLQKALKLSLGNRSSHFFLGIV
jgi:hypothetical protein